METIKLLPGLEAKVVRRTDTEVELDLGGKGNYTVCANGDIFSTNYRGTGKTNRLKAILSSNGYSNVGLYSNNTLRTMQVHRLVGLCFIKNTDNKPQINHINEIKTDNRVENLEWCTSEYNNNHATRTDRMRKTKFKPVTQLTLSGEFIRVWDSATEAGENGFNYCCISFCCTGRKQTHKGYRWEFAK